MIYPLRFPRRHGLQLWSCLNGLRVSLKGKALQGYHHAIKGPRCSSEATVLLAISSQFVVQRGWLPADVSLFGVPGQIYPITLLEVFYTVVRL